MSITSMLRGILLEVILLASCRSKRHLCFVLYLIAIDDKKRKKKSEVMIDLSIISKAVVRGNLCTCIYIMG